MWRGAALLLLCLVTFTFGGDDLGFKSIVYRCLGIDPKDIATIALSRNPIATSSVNTT